MVVGVVCCSDVGDVLLIGDNYELVVSLASCVGFGVGCACVWLWFAGCVGCEEWEVELLAEVCDVLGVGVCLGGWSHVVDDVCDGRAWWSMAVMARRSAVESRAAADCDEGLGSLPSGVRCVLARRRR